VFTTGDVFTISLSLSLSLSINLRDFGVRKSDTGGKGLGNERRSWANGLLAICLPGARAVRGVMMNKGRGGRGGLELGGTSQASPLPFSITVIFYLPRVKISILILQLWIY